MSQEDGILFDDPETAVKQKFKVTVELYIDAEDHGEAEEKVHEFMRDVILAFSENSDKDMRFPYDITDIEAAEIDFD